MPLTPTPTEPKGSTRNNGPLRWTIITFPGITATHASGDAVDGLDEGLVPAHSSSMALQQMESPVAEGNFDVERSSEVATRSLDSAVRDDECDTKV